MENNVLDQLIEDLQHLYLDRNAAQSSLSAKWEDVISRVREAKDTLERLDKMVKISPDMICVIDEQGVFQYVSQASRELLGYDPEELKGKPFTYFILAEDIEKTSEHRKKIVEVDWTYSFENRYLRKDGRVIYLLWSAKYDKATRQIHAVARDATERMHAEIQLRESAEMMRGAAKLSKLGYWRLSVDGKTLIWSDEVYEIWGRKKEYFEVSFEQFFETIHPEDRELFLAEQDQSFAGLKEHDFIHRILLPNGEIRWVHELGKLEKDEQGNPLFFHGSVQDITQKKEQEYLKYKSSEIKEYFGQSFGLKKTMERVLMKMKEGHEFVIGEFWLVNPYNQELQLLSHTNGNDTAHTFYQNLQGTIKFQYGEGFPGKIWEAGDMLVWEDLVNHPEFLRKREAGLAGVSSMVGFPIVHNESILGVVIFGMRIAKHLPQNKIKYLKELVELIGSEINRKQLEEELNSIFTIAPDMIMILGKDGSFKKVNPKTIEILGLGEMDWENLTIEQLIDDRDLATWKEAKERLSRGETVNYFEIRLSGRKEEIKWLAWSLTPSEEDGIIYAVAKDISENKRLNELLNNVHQLARIGAWEVDLIKSTVYWSEMTKEIHEVPKDYEPSFEKGVEFYVEGWSRNTLEELFGQSINEGIKFDHEFLIRTGLGNERWVRVIGEPIFSGDQCVKMIGSFQDIHASKMMEDRLLAIGNNIPGVLFQYYRYADGRQAMLYVSKGSKDLWGIEAEDCPKQMDAIWAQIEAGGDIEKVKAALNTSAENMELWNCEWRSVGMDGRVRWHEGYGTPKQLADGTVYWDTLVIDITEKKYLEELLARTHEIARIGGWELDLSGGNSDQMYWSSMTKEILEVDRSYNPSLTGGFEFYTPQSRKAIEQAVEQLIQTGEAFDLELLLVTAKGKERWVRCIGNSERANGVCKKIFGSFQDIHAIKTAEIELAGSHKKLVNTLESIQDGFYSVDANWTVTYWNNKAEELLLTKREDILGKNLWEEFKEAKELKFYEVYSRVMELQLPEQFEEYFPPLNSWYEVTVYPSENGLTVFFKDITNKKVAEKILIQYKNIIENTIDGIALADHEGNAIYMNPGFCEILGYTVQTLAEAGGPPVVYKDAQQAQEIFGALLQGRPWRGDVDLVRMDGKVLHFYLSGGPIFDEQGKLIAIYGIHTNITERKEAEKALQLAYEERNIILESIGDAFFAVERDWTVTYWNRVAEEMLETPRDLVLGKNLWEVFSDAVDLPSYRYYHQALENQAKVTFEDYYPKLKKWYEITAYPSDLGLSVYFKDVTLRKTSEELIRKANERFELAAEATNDAIWDWDVVSNTLSWGKGFHTLFGYILEGSIIPIAKWSQKIHPEDKARVLLSLDDAIQNKQVTHWQEEYRFLKDDGTYAYVIDRGIILRDQFQSAIRMVGAMTDITYRREFEESLLKLNRKLEVQARDLEESNKELEQFAYVASHDLQEPLRMVSSFLSQLETKYGDQIDQKGKTYIRFAVDGAKRMRQVILDLLEFSRVGKLKDQYEWISVKHLIEEGLPMQAQLIQEKNAEIIIGNLPEVFTYKTPLGQVFQNLISNALKYSRDGVKPIIKIHSKKLENEWQFEVSDNGIGIGEEYFKKIFIIFQRLHNREKYGGSGMGLAIVKKIVESLGGRIWLTSKVGEGSTFYFTVPIHHIENAK